MNNIEVKPCEYARLKRIEAAAKRVAANRGYRFTVRTRKTAMAALEAALKECDE